MIKDRVVWYVVKKIGSALLTLFTIALVTFLLARHVPGGPFDNEKVQPEHIKRLQEQKYGFDKPPLVHFWNYFVGVLHGDLGVSIKFEDRSVATIIWESMPITFGLGALSLLFGIFVGIPMGVVSALKPHSIWDVSGAALFVSGITLPPFLIAAILVLLFCHFLGWLPPARLDGPEYYILPVATLGIRPAAILARLVRSTLLNELSTDYIRTARAKGVSETLVVIKHAFRNCFVPIVTVMGPVAANILTGSFIVEHFFAIPGMAKHFIFAVGNRDVFLMLGVTLVYASVLILTNLLVDLSYPFLDPRMKLGNR